VDWLGQITDPGAIGHFLNHCLEQMTTATFWAAVGRIIWIDMLLSGDNALVIALACRGLPPRYRTLGMVLGAGAAVLLRVIFTGIVASLMALAWLKLAGGLALLVIAAKLVVPGSDDTPVSSASGLWQAVQIIVVADFIMSLDNVIAVAAAANGSILLLAIGLLVSIPIIVAGAALIMMLLSRLPILVWAGAALLGWIAGTVIASDPALAPALHGFFSGPFAAALEKMAAGPGLSWPGLSLKAGGIGDLVMGLAGIAVVLVAGYIWRRRVLHQAALEASRRSAGQS